MNSDELFKARALADRQVQIKKLEDQRKSLLGKMQHRLDAEEMIKKHNCDLTNETKHKFNLNEVKTLLR